MDPVCILCDELKGDGNICSSHDSALVLDFAHEGRSGGSLRGIGAYFDCVGLVVCEPKQATRDGTENRQDEECAPFPHKHIDGNGDTDHGEDLGDGGYGKEAEASVAANQV